MFCLSIDKSATAQSRLGIRPVLLVFTVRSMSSLGSYLSRADAQAGPDPRIVSFVTQWLICFKRTIILSINDKLSWV